MLSIKTKKASKKKKNQQIFHNVKVYVFEDFVIWKVSLFGILISYNILTRDTKETQSNILTT